MKKSLITLTVMLVAAALVIVFCGPAAAKVTGVCSGCHTMHDSQGGTAMATGGPHGTLLMDSCVGCHSDDGSRGYPTYDLGGCLVPVVNKLGGEPSEYLAGGNFYWVADSHGNDDAKGHNVLGISGTDSLAVAPGGFDCGNDNCHKSLAVAPTNTALFGPGGCQGCHLAPAHHANDSATVTGAAVSSTDGYYRFLSGHMTGDTHGVCGIEDDNWQETKSTTDHNEYLGNAVNLSTSANLSSLGHTMTGYCCGCHGNFHDQNTESDGSGSWIRHPSDAKIPITGEYAAYTVYDPVAPVARPDLTGWTGPSAEVNESGAVSKDMVMCLSCHRPHGSPYDDLLRWEYKGGGCDAGGPSGSCGCMRCHTQKGT